MPTVKFPPLMKFYVDNQTEFKVNGATIADILENILLRYPTLQPHLYTPKGELRRYFNIFINGVHIRDLNGLQTVVEEEDKVIIMASAAGGQV